MGRPDQQCSGNPRPYPQSSYPTYPAQFPAARQQGRSGTNPYAGGGPPNAQAPPPPLRITTKPEMPVELMVPLPPSPTIHRRPEMSAHPRPPLFRKGNATSPQFHRVRPGKDIPVSDNGMVYPNTGGVSTNTVPLPDCPANRLWRFPGDTSLGYGLVAVNDQGTHVLIAPAEEMPMDTFVQKLGELNSKAQRCDKLGNNPSAPSAPAPSKAAKAQKAKPKNQKPHQPGPGSAGQSSSRG